MHSVITAKRTFFELSTVSNGKVKGCWKSGSVRATMLDDKDDVVIIGTQAAEGQDVKRLLTGFHQLLLINQYVSKRTFLDMAMRI